MENNLIHYTKPSITKLEEAYAADAVKNGWGIKCYEYIGKFEDSFRTYLDVEYSVATSSCTGALQLGLAASNVGKGDEIILADTNWVATVSPIISLGAKPIFVDILEDSWCIDPQKVEEAITHKTKAIVATHLYGNLCMMDELLEIANKNNIMLIEDAAEAIGSIYRGKRAGSMGHFSCFSFHGSKTITTGEGGMLVTSNSSLYNKVLTLNNHGRRKGEERQFWSETIGYKYKMSNVQASIGLAQMERIDHLVSRKQEILKFYKNFFIDRKEVKLNPETKGNENGSWMPTIVFDKNINITREVLLAAFKKENIDARVFFWPLSSLPMFKAKKGNKNSWSIPKRSINLPSYHDITENDLRRVSGVVMKLLAEV